MSRPESSTQDPEGNVPASSNTLEVKCVTLTGRAVQRSHVQFDPVETVLSGRVAQ